MLIDATLEGELSRRCRCPSANSWSARKKIWDELGLPPLKPETPWFGYSLGEWPDELDAAAERAVKGDYFATGAEQAKRRRKDVAHQHRSARPRQQSAAQGESKARRLRRWRRPPRSREGGGGGRRVNAGRREALADVIRGKQARPLARMRTGPSPDRRRLRGAAPLKPCSPFRSKDDANSRAADLREPAAPLAANSCAMARQADKFLCSAAPAWRSAGRLALPMIMTA